MLTCATDVQTIPIPARPLQRVVRGSTHMLLLEMPPRQTARAPGGAIAGVSLTRLDK
jgi:hypothetical protein